MPQDFAKVIAELDAATANLKRSIRRSRAFIADRRAPDDVAPAEAAPPEPDAGMFVWRGRHDG